MGLYYSISYLAVSFKKRVADVQSSRLKGSIAKEGEALTSPTGLVPSWTLQTSVHRHLSFSPTGHWGIGLVAGKKVATLAKKLRAPLIMVCSLLLADRLQGVCHVSFLAC